MYYTSEDAEDLSFAQCHIANNVVAIQTRVRASKIDTLSVVSS